MLGTLSQHVKEEAEEQTGPAAEADKSQHLDDCQDNYIG